ncbi:MAG: M56 family metallopeptidase, partial [Lachnospiraceae bacterium]|nr:M56 family metallopeptidase [Lachnospiraceae bacterium]
MRFICFLVGSGSLIGVLLLVRSKLRGRLSPEVLYALWLLPAVRLLLPFTMIPVPVLPEAVGEAVLFEEDAEEVEETIADHAAIVGNAQGAESVEVKIRGITEAVSLTGSGGNTQGEVQTERLPEHQRRGVVSCLASIWISGSIFCAGYVILINGSLKRRVGQMERLPDKRLVPVYIRNEAVSPCLFGVFHPCILLSRQTAENWELCALALLHEETHYRQKDHIWTALRILLCILYWWNPLVWLGAARAREDAEYACDARALRGASLSERKAYGYALLEIVQGVQNFGRLVHGITPISGNGKNMKIRLENIVSEHKRTRVWPLPVCLLLCLFLCGLCFPVQK